MLCLRPHTGQAKRRSGIHSFAELTRNAQSLRHMAVRVDSGSSRYFVRDDNSVCDPYYSAASPFLRRMAA